MTTDRARPRDTADNDQKPVGYGRMLRKEDPRFIRGQGNYVDDVQLPGMLHLAILRSPYAHARIKQHRHHRRAGPPEGEGRHHRRGPGREGPGLDADAVQRHPGRAGHRQGALPGPGGGVRRRRGPLLGPRCARAHRRRLRAAGPGDRRPHGARPRRAGDPRRPGGQDRQPHLRLGGRRRGRDRRRLRHGRRRRQAGDRLSPRASRADGDLRLRSPTGPGDRQADAVVHDPGAARPPHGVRARGRVARAQDPRHRPDIGGGFGNKVPIYPGYVCAIVGVDGHRQAGEVDGGPQREPDRPPASPATTHGRRDRRDQRRQDPGDPRQRAGRPRRVQRRRRADQVPGRFLPRLHRQLRHRGRVLPHDAASTPTRHPAGWPTPARSAITEAVYLVERMVDCLAYELEMDPGRAADART